jgi:hypothetical protein
MTYHYYGVKDNWAWQLDWHKSWLPHKPHTNSLHMPRLMRESDQVWVQGPRGGVQLIKCTYWDYWATYLRRDSEKMKQFLWVKLSARKLNQP